MLEFFLQFFKVEVVFNTLGAARRIVTGRVFLRTLGVLLLLGRALIGTWAALRARGQPLEHGGLLSGERKTVGIDDGFAAEQTIRAGEFAKLDLTM